jgi:simple sugar transport system permease protein
MNKRASGLGYWLHSFPAGNIIIIFGALQLGCVLCGYLFPNEFRYLSPANIRIVMRAIPQTAIVAIGVGMLMIAGEFDLSVGAIFSLSSIAMGEALNHGHPLPVAVTLGLCVGVLIGFFNGLVVVHFRIPSFIATLGSMMILRGIILYLAGTQTIRFLPGAGFRRIITGEIGIFQAQFLWLLVIAVISWIIMERHRLGNQIFATGGNPQTARALGVNVNKIKLIVFAITGFSAAIAGMISTTRVGSISPIQGQGLELQAIAACVIGGNSLRGGRGSIIGIFLGAALVHTVQDILLLLRAPGYYLESFIGLVIVCAAILNQKIQSQDPR